MYTPTEFQQIFIQNHPRQKRAVFLPLVAGLSLASSVVAVGLGGGALAQSLISTDKLTSQFQLAIDASVESLASLQRQITSVAQVSLQNRRALDLLTAEKGGTCIFLQEECCYYINESGIVETRVDTLQKLSNDLQRQKFSSEATSWWKSSMFSLLAPLLGPLIIIITLLLIAPCFLRFLQTRFREITRVAVHQMMLQQYQPLSTLPDPDFCDFSAPPHDAPPQQEAAR